MTDRRSRGLTADLLADLEATTATDLGAPVAAPSTGPFLQTTLFLRPSEWSWPGIGRDGTGVVLSAGPWRVRGGR